MKTWLSPARSAGILYLQFSVLCLAALWLWLGDWSWQDLRHQLPNIAGAMELLAVLMALTLASAVLGTWLTFRARVNILLVALGAITAIAASWWHLLAAVFWSVPVALMLFAYKKPHAG